MFPYVIENALPPDMFRDLYDDMSPNRCTWNHWTLDNVSDVGEYGDASHSSWYLWDCTTGLVYKKIGAYLKYSLDRYYHSLVPESRPRFELVRVHTNGQTSGQLSEFHVDFFDSCYYTVVLFTNLSWNTNWGGEFTVRDPKGKYHLIPYIPNHAVLIPSDWSHNGSAPNSKTDQLRTTLAVSYYDPSCPWTLVQSRGSE